jgi:hypothetical protein
LNVDNRVRGEWEVMEVESNSYDFTTCYLATLCPNKLSHDSSLLAIGFRNELSLWKVHQKMLKQETVCFRKVIIGDNANEYLKCSTWTSIVPKNSVKRADHYLAVGSSEGNIYLADCGVQVTSTDQATKDYHPAFH